MCGIFGFIAVSDVSVGYDANVCASDASLQKGAFTAANIGAESIGIGIDSDVAVGDFPPPKAWISALMQLRFAVVLACFQRRWLVRGLLSAHPLTSQVAGKLI